MFLRQFAVLVGLFVAVLGSQLPEFSQQYRQRLGGAVDEIKRAVAAFEAEAENQSLTFEQAVERLKENADPLARQRAADMEADAARERRLEAAQADMAGAGPLMRLLAMLRDFDPEIAHRAYEAYEPAVPITQEGWIVALAGFVIGWLATHMSLWPVRRRLADRRLRRAALAAEEANLARPVSRQRI